MIDNGKGLCAHTMVGSKVLQLSAVLETSEEQQRTIPAGSQNWATTQISCACEGG